jgi:hypothetical protein
MPRERASVATLARNAPLENIQEEEDMDHRRRELESQKARIVAQMVPVSATTNNFNTLAAAQSVQSLATVSAMMGSSLPPSRPVSMIRSSVTDENVPPAAPATMSASAAAEPKPKKNPISIPVVSSSAVKNAKAYDVFAHTLAVAFHAKKEGKLFRDPSKFKPSSHYIKC